MPVSSGEAISRYGNDVGEVADFPTWLPWVAGHVVSFVVAVTIMARINLTITLVVVLPLVATVSLSRLAWSRFLSYRHASRVAAGRVTAFLGELFGAAQAVKIANAEEDVLAHMQRLNETRRSASVRDRVFEGLLNGLYSTATIFGTGVILLLAGRAIAAGTFTVGDFALFVDYLWIATGLPSLIGTFIGDTQQQAVSIGRLAELVPDEPPAVLLAPLEAGDRAASPSPAAPELAPDPDDRLERLDVRGLTYHYDEDGHGITAIDLCLRRGSLTVVTGRDRLGQEHTAARAAGAAAAPGRRDRLERAGCGRPGGLPQAPALRLHRPGATPVQPDPAREHPAGPAGSRGGPAWGAAHGGAGAGRGGPRKGAGHPGRPARDAPVGRPGTARGRPRACSCAAPSCWPSTTFPARSTWRRSAACGSGSTSSASTTTAGPAPRLTALVVSHRRAVLQRADHVIVLKDGRDRGRGPAGGPAADLRRAATAVDRHVAGV